MVPVLESRLTRRLATVWPAVKLAVEVPVLLVESTLRKPPFCGSVAVRLRVAAVAPAGAGEPVAPATLMVRAAPALTAVRVGLLVVPARVSTSRVGVVGAHWLVGPPAVREPVTSATRWTVPPEWLTTVMVPVLESRLTRRLA